MSIYKYVSPENGSNSQNISQNIKNIPAEENNSNDDYEYFSDKEEAETYKKDRSKSSKSK